MTGILQALITSNKTRDQEKPNDEHIEEESNEDSPKSELIKCAENFETLAEENNDKASTERRLMFKLVGLALIATVFSPYFFNVMDMLIMSQFDTSVSIKDAKEERKQSEQQISQIIKNLPNYIWSSTENDERINNAFLLANENNSLNPAYYLESGHGIITGKNGRVFYQKDNDNWRAIATDTLSNENFTSITTSPNKKLITTSTKGNIYISDNGIDWHKNPIGDKTELSSPVFPTDNIGVIIARSGNIYVSIDSGANWSLKTPTDIQNTKSLLGISFFDNNKIGIIRGVNDTILYSNDFGQSWNIASFNTKIKYRENIRAIFYHNKQLTAIGHLGNIYFSDDKGANWQLKTINTTISPLGLDYFNTPTITPGGMITVIGAKQNLQSVLLYSTDLGANWREIEFTTDITLNPPIYSARGVGLITTNSGTLLITSNDSTWIKRNLPRQYSITSALFTKNEKILLATQSGQIISSSDYGLSWPKKDTLSNSSLNYLASSISQQPLVDEVIAAVSANGEVHISNNQGATWQNQQLKLLSVGELSAPLFSHNKISLTANNKIITATKINHLQLIENYKTDQDYERTVEKLIDTSLYKTAAALDKAITIKQANDKIITELEAVKPIDNKTERLIIRVSALALFIFLIQVVVTSQRYHIKLANFYLSRAQSLRLAEEFSAANTMDVELSSLISLLTPTTDFGKDHSMPIEQFISLSSKLKPNSSSQ